MAATKDLLSYNIGILIKNINCNTGVYFPIEGPQAFTAHRPLLSVLQLTTKNNIGLYTLAIPRAQCLIYNIWGGGVFHADYVIAGHQL